MPAYLCHGFRWHRYQVDMHVIVNDLEDAASGWLMGTTTASLVLNSFYDMFDFIPLAKEEHADPEERQDTPVQKGKETQGDTSEKETQRPTPLRPTLHARTKTPNLWEEDTSDPAPRIPPSEDAVLCHEWSSVKLLEEYDPEERSQSIRPHAYVADFAVRVDLGMELSHAMSEYEKLAETWDAKEDCDREWLGKLKEKLQPKEEIQWFVVVCGDAERAVPGSDEDDEEEDEDDEDDGSGTETDTGTYTTSQAGSTAGEPSPLKQKGKEKEKEKAEKAAEGETSKGSRQVLRKKPSKARMLLRKITRKDSKE